MEIDGGPCNLTSAGSFPYFPLLDFIRDHGSFIHRKQSSLIVKNKFYYVLKFKDRPLEKLKHDGWKKLQNGGSVAR